MVFLLEKTLKEIRILIIQNILYTEIINLGLTISPYWPVTTAALISS